MLTARVSGLAVMRITELMVNSSPPPFEPPPCVPTEAAPPQPVAPIAVTAGQLEHEWRHLMAKLAHRSPVLHERWRAALPDCHPMFRLRPGAVEPWERM